jgi:hypothetical protein
MTPEQERALRREAEALSSLEKHPGFVALVKVIERKRESMKRTLADRLMNPDETAIDMQRQADYDRGFYAGASYSSQVVEGARAAMEKWDAGAEVTEPEEEADGWSSV